MVVREIIAKLGLDVNAQSLLKALTVFEVAKGALGTLKNTFEGAINAISSAVVETAKYGDEMVKMSQRTGISTDSLQGLGYAAEMSGSSIQGMGVGLKFLARNAFEASTKGGEAADAFKSIGVSLKDASGKMKDPEELFLDVADAIAKMEDPNKRAAMSMKLLGRSGTELLPLMLEGRRGIEELKEEAKVFGLVLDKDAAQAGVKLSDSLDRIHKIGTGLKNLLVGPLLDPINDVLELFVAWRKENDKIIRQRITDVVQVLTKVIKGFGEGLKFTVQWLKLFGMILASIALAILLTQIPTLTMLAGAYLAAGLAATLAGLKAAAAWIAAAAPVALLAGLLLLIALTAEDFYYYLTGGKSAMGEFSKDWDKIKQSWYTSEGDGWLLTALKAILWYLTEAIPKAISDIIDQKPGFFGAVGKVLGIEQRKPDAGMLPLSKTREAPELNHTGFGATIAGLIFGPQPTRYVANEAFGGGASPNASASFSSSDQAPLYSKVEMPITVVQQPGEDGSALASKIVEIADQRIKTHIEEAAAATE